MNLNKNEKKKLSLENIKIRVGYHDSGLTKILFNLVHLNEAAVEIYLYIYIF